MSAPFLSNFVTVPTIVPFIETSLNSSSSSTPLPSGCSKFTQSFPPSSNPLYTNTTSVDYESQVNSNDVDVDKPVVIKYS